MSDLPYPRVALGHWPTPLEWCDRLPTGGAAVWVKRDDCTGLGGGGNKARKLEFLLGRALAEGAGTVVTFGAVQSNHARQTAAACNRLGLCCELILTRSVPRSDALYEKSGNVLLDRLFGARLHIVDDVDGAVDVYVKVEHEVVQRQGRKPYVIPPGGSDTTGVLGYVAGALELADQLRTARLTPSRIIVATGTAGTAAGLVLGLARAGVPAVVEAICIYEEAAPTRAELDRLVRECAALLGMAPPDGYRVHDAWLGPGYGVPTPETAEAVRLFARTQGLLLDPVYTGKAAAALFAMIRDGRIGREETVVFLHTGGTPGLFAYGDALLE